MTSIHCRDLIAHLAEYQDQALEPLLHTQLQRHLQACPDCQALLADLRELPRLIQRLEPSAEDLLRLGDRALAEAMKRLNQSHPRRRIELAPALQHLLDGPKDLPLRLMAETHRAFLRGELPQAAPFLPTSVLAQLPAPATWKWTHRNGIRRALVAKDPVGGQRLSLMSAPPQVQLPRHRHLGSESLLILNGVMEDGDRCLSEGQWIYLEPGSTHSPCMLSPGCWCLVRDEGTVRYELGASA